MTTYKAAIVQATPVVFDLEATLARLRTLVAEAAANGARLVVFPEVFLSGYPSGLDWGGPGTGIRLQQGQEDYARYWSAAMDPSGSEERRIGQVAQEFNIVLIVGCLEREGGTLHCTVLFFDASGTCFGRRRKLMPTVAERLVWGRGDGSTLVVHQTELGRIGAVICWENYMPLLRASMYAQDIEIYVAPTADDWETWAASMRHVALEGRCYVLSSCQYTQRKHYPADYGAFPSDDPEFVVMRGGSCVVDPFGNIISGPVFNAEAILYADIDLGLVTRGKYLFDVCGHYSRPDIFTLQVDRRQQQDTKFLDDHV